MMMAMAMVMAMVMSMAMEITWIVGGDGFGVNIDHDEPHENDVVPGGTAR